MKTLKANLSLSAFLPFLGILLVGFTACADDSYNPTGPKFPEEQGEVDPFERNSALGRGINLGNALEAPNEGEWGVVLESEYFSVIKEAGFNSVRIPIKWSAHASTVFPYTINNNFFSRIDWVINEALRNGLTAIINIHHYDEIMTDPYGEKERFLKIWEQIGERYKNYTRDLFFEILNEPNTNLTAEVWNEFLSEAILKIRETNPNRTLIAGLAEWGGLGSLARLNLPEGETNVIVSFHYYSPFHFTHQGAEWVDNSEAWLGTKWAGTAIEQAVIIGDFETMFLWAKSRNLPINLGEFGAYYKADFNSRILWTSFIRQTAEVYDISWNYWEFCAGFGIYDRVEKIYVQDLLNALIPPGA